MTALTLERTLGWGRTLSTGLLLGGAAILVVGLLAAFGSEQLGYDLRTSYLPAADAVLDGVSPYPSPDDDVLEEERGYVYPPLVAVALAPLAALPVDLVALLAVLGAGAALVGALALVGVRDVRCYAAAFVSAPAWNALEMANLSAVLALGLAVVWRYRDDARSAGLALGLATAAKLLLWPLILWGVATGRARLAAWAVTSAIGAIFLAWAAIGFAGLGEYLELVRRLSDIQSEKSYSFVGMSAALGLGESVGQVAGLAAGAALLAWCLVLARRGDDVGSFTCAVVAALAVTPIVWQHYLVLLFVPLAITRPRFSWPWLLPVLIWVSPRAGHGDGFEPFVPAVVTAALLAFALAEGVRRARHNVVWAT